MDLDDIRFSRSFNITWQGVYTKLSEFAGHLVKVVGYMVNRDDVEISDGRILTLIQALSTSARHFIHLGR